MKTKVKKENTPGSKQWEIKDRNYYLTGHNSEPLTY